MASSNGPQFVKRGRLLPRDRVKDFRAAHRDFDRSGRLDRSAAFDDGSLDRGVEPQSGWMGGLRVICYSIR